jgi:putative transposase
MAAKEDPLLNTVADRLEHRATDLVVRQMHALREFPGYRRVPDDDLRRSCLRNVARVVATLRQQDELPPHIIEDELASGRRRALQDVPSEEVVRAYRTVLRVLRDAFIEEATSAGVNAEDVLAGTRLLWDLTDRNSSVLVTARQQVEIESARRDERQRLRFLQRLLGGIDPAELTEHSQIHGFDPEREYWVVRAHQDSPGFAAVTLHLESQSGSESSRPLITPFEDDVAAVCSIRPAPMNGTLIAVAGPVPPLSIPRAFAEATRVLQVARRYRREGVVDTSSLSVRLAVEQHRELGAQLHDRYLGPLSAMGSPMGDELLRTLRTYFRQGRSIPACARSLDVHENTVRYRIERFEHLTGSDLTRTDTLVELWWALEYATLYR